MYKFLPILLFAYGLAITADDIYDNSYALIIGIDKYENVRSLDYAVKDAEDIQSMLVDKFNFQQENIVLLKDEEATKTSIIQEFSNITKKAGDNDRVLIFFAGHGKTQDLPDGGEMGYLMPVNGDEKDLYISAIDMDELRKISLLSEAKHILYLVDACYGGIASVGARSIDANTTSDYLQKITQDKARQMISAGGRGEEVIEKAEWGHSAFTKNLLSGLRDSKADTDSDGIITVQELGTYLKRKVTLDSDNQQTPKTRNLSTDEGEFVFVYAENTAVTQDKSDEEKLDYLISEIEELKSKKSISEEIVLDNTTNEYKSWYEKYGYKGHGIGFSLFEDLYTINLQMLVDKNWGYGVVFMHCGTKAAKRLMTIQEGHTIIANSFAIGTGQRYYINDRLNADIGAGVGYLRVNWEDTLQKTSGIFNLILPSVSSGVGLDMGQYEFPLPIRLVFYGGLTLGYYPGSYAIDRGEIITFSDWKIKLTPNIAFALQMPK